MSAVVAIPTCRRPEMLALCLRALDGAAGCPDDVRIYADTPTNLEDVEYVRDTFLPHATIYHAKTHLNTPSGCWNILNAIKSASRAAESVYLVEEDVRVYPGFFAFHEAQNDVLASVGRRDRTFYPLHPDIYTNPGSCLRRPLLDALLPHINDDYFRRLRGYLDEHFGKWDEMSNLDDGLIRRVIRQLGGRTVFADPQVCVHQGWHFYNRIDVFMNNEGTIQERIVKLEKMMETLVPARRYAFDFEPYQP